MEIIGLPGGMAARHFGFDPVQWEAAMALRAQVISGLNEARQAAVERHPARRQEGAAGTSHSA